MAGSFSLIRFRSVQGTGQKILAVFLAVAVGLCLGAGYAAVACLLMAVFLLFHALLTACLFGGNDDQMRELRISVPESLEYDGLFDDLLSEAFEACRLEKVRTAEIGTVYQLIYRVKTGKAPAGKGFLDRIRERNGNLPVSLGRIPDARTEM